MRIRLLAALVAATFAASFFVAAPAANASGCGSGGESGGPFDSGNGSAGTPFLVSTATQLQSLNKSACLGFEFKQTKDINLSGATWTPIGTSAAFTGKYDGNFHTISNLSVTGVVNAGLFATISGATLKNLTLKNPTISGSGLAGALVSFTTTGSTIEKVAIVGGSVTSTGNNAGGLTGMTQSGRSWISYVSVDAQVSAAGNAGGVVGQVESVSASVLDVAFKGTVTSSGQMSGGIVGYGIAPDITRAYSIGTITGGTDHRGGVLAHDGTGGGSVQHSFFLGTGVTQLDSNYAFSKSAAELKTLLTFTDRSWSITSNTSAAMARTATEDWLINPDLNGGYPILMWQIAGFATGDFLTSSSNQVVAPRLVTDTYSGASSNYFDWQLTENQPTRAGAIWYKNRLELTGDFEINAEIYLGTSDAGADGLAFVLQQSSTSSITTGGGLGFSGIVPAFAVEFDTFPNGTNDHADSSSDYWGMYNNPSTAGGSASTLVAVDPDNVAGTEKQFSLGNIEDSNWRAVKFTWEASTKTFAASIDNNRDGDFADAGEVISKAGLVLTGADSTFGSNPVYWGFTASTGGSTNEQRVRFKSTTGFLATLFANASPTIQDRTNQNLILASGTQVIDFALSDDRTTQAQWSLSATSSDTAKATVSVALTSATNARLTVTPVAPGPTTMTLTVTDADGASASESLVFSVMAVSDAPAGVTATVSAGVTSAALTWSTPSSNGGSVITGYKIEQNVSSSWTTVIADTASTLTSYTVIGLAIGGTYTFRVSAINAVGISSASTASSSVTIVASAPGAPTGVTATVSAGVTSAALTWSTPSSNGGSVIAGYKIEQNVSSSWTTVIADTASTLTSYSVTGLAIGGTYTFRVSAINAVGASTAGVSASVTIAAAPAPASTPNSGPIPTGISSSKASSGDKIVISGRGLGTVISVTIDGVNIKVSNQSATAFEITIPEGLLPGIKDIRIVSGSGSLTYARAIEIMPQQPALIGDPVMNQKVNAGSFKGYVALYALNHEGKRLSAKVGNDWVIVESIPKSVNNLYRHVEFTGVGYEVQVRIFIDRKLEATIPLLTK